MAQQTKMPMVSVIMPAYNAAAYIAEAIRSVQSQTMMDWELLVIDDCSSDDTRQIVQTLARKDSRIHLLPNEKNMGTARTRNRGMDLCHGVYIALLDSDDVWYPQKLQQQIDLAEETGADIVYCSYAMVDQQRKPKCPDL